MGIIAHNHYDREFRVLRLFTKEPLDHLIAMPDTACRTGDEKAMSDIKRNQ